MRRLIGLFICLESVLCGVDFNYEGDLAAKNKPLFVSLGSHCEIALTLRNSSNRAAAFPFDWIVTRNHKQLIKVLDEDFSMFMDENSFTPLNDALHSVINHYYDFLFHHEWPFSDDSVNPDRYAQQIEAIKVKYNRRITRFRELRNYPGKIFFIRNPYWEEGGDMVEITVFKEALRRYFPALNFTLVIVSYIDQNAPDIVGIDQVVSFKILRSYYDQEYQQVYQRLLDQEN